MAFKLISLLIALLLSTSANAALLSYRIQANGDVVSSTSLKYYRDDVTNGYWTLDSANNTIRNSIYGNVSSPLNTHLFQVSDITDMTWSNGTEAYFTTSNNLSYKVTVGGAVLERSTLKYYRDDINGSTWTLDGANNTIRHSALGNVSNQLNTNLFQVSDILDMTYTDGSAAYFTTGNNSSYKITPDGNVIANTSVRFYRDYVTGYYWTLDGANNRLGYSRIRGLNVLNTNLFQVNDIVDMTLSGNDEAWFLVDDGISAVPVPAAVWLFGSGLFGLVGIARRKKV